MVEIPMKKIHDIVRVLIVDDSSTMCAMIDQVLSNDRRFEVVGYAGTVQAARIRMEELKPDIVTLDLVLPDGSGFELLERDDAGKGATKIIVVAGSAGSGSEYARKAVQLGANGVFDKARIMHDAERFRSMLHDAVHRCTKLKAAPGPVFNANGLNPAQPPVPADEAARLRMLDRLGMAKIGRDERFDGITELAAEMLDFPAVLLNVIGRTEQYVKSVGGSAGLKIGRTARNIAFCAHTIASEDVMIVPDARKDPRFMANPLVTGDPGIRFYAGAPLIAADGIRLGALCAIDFHPRSLNEIRAGQLRKFSGLASALL